MKTISKTEPKLKTALPGGKKPNIKLNFTFHKLNFHFEKTLQLVIDISFCTERLKMIANV